MKPQTQTKIKNFLKNLNTEIDILNCIEIENIDIEDAYSSIYDMISESNGFDIEIIYYSDAMDYLHNNDNSLKDSLQIASEYGYTLENINSEVLASLLASQNAESEFQDLAKEINNFFEEIATEIENYTIQVEFDECEKMKIFEISVKDKRTKKDTYIIFEIEIYENKFWAKHEGTTHEEEKSDKIAFVSVDIDPLFSLDEHLQELHEECNNKILNSDFFTLN
jgi:hypothetical protein